MFSFSRRVSSAWLQWHDFIYKFRNSINNVGGCHGGTCLFLPFVRRSLGSAASRKDSSLLPPFSFPVYFYNFLFEKSSVKLCATPRLLCSSSLPSRSFFSIFHFLHFSLSRSASPFAAPACKGWETKRNSHYASPFGFGIPLRNLGAGRQQCCMYIKKPRFVSIIYRNRWDADPNLPRSICSIVYRFPKTKRKKREKSARGFAVNPDLPRAFDIIIRADFKYCHPRARGIELTSED